MNRICDANGEASKLLEFEMRRLIGFIGVIPLCLFLLLGCSGTSKAPVEPSDSDNALWGSSGENQSLTQLWAYYDVAIDPAIPTVNAIAKRQAMFTANVVQYLNSNPSLLSFAIKKVKFLADSIDVDLNIGITHPFSTMTQFNGYDVRGVFMGNGSEALSYNTKLKYPVDGTDQCMIPNPVTGYGGPDGYTRWFNITEFNSSQLPIVEYTQGIFATPGFAGTATLCPYKYFADSLGETDDLWTWLNNNGASNGVFSAGHTNTRNYYLRFPKTDGLVFGYAVLANWKGTAPSAHPANARETVALSVTITPDLYFTNESEKGGKLILDISVFDWTSQLTGGVMKDYRIFIESTVLSTWQKYVDPTPTGSGEHCFTYHFEITPDNLHSSGNHQLWVIVDYPGQKYKNQFGIPNLAGNDLLAAAFRYSVYVHNKPYKSDPICKLKVDPSTPAYAEEWDIYSSNVNITFDTAGSYDPDGTALSYEWDFDGDGAFSEDPDDSYQGPANKPTHTYTKAFVGDVCVRLTDENDGTAECCVGVGVEIHPSKNIPLKSGIQARDLAVNSANGDLLILYSDKTVYKYRDSDYYDPNDGVLLITLPPELPAMNYIDVSELGYVVTGTSSRLANFTPAGEWVGVDYTPASAARDVWTLANDGDLYANDHCSIWGGIDGPYHYHYVGRAIDPNFNDEKTFHKLTSESYTGYDHLYDGYIRAMEGDVSSKAIWSLEGSPDNYAARWDLPYLDYNNAYFGTGIQTNEDDGFYDPKDLTRSGNILYVLDKLSSGQPRIKAWQVDGDVVTQLGGFGDSSNISGSPLRIDGGEYVNPDGDNLLFVLHNSGSDYMLSIFFPSDLPWG